MGVIDDLVQGFSRVVRWVDLKIEGLGNPDVGDEEFTDAGGQIVEGLTPADEAAGNVVDLVEETILADLQQAGQLDPENVEQLVDDIEGGQVALLLGVLGGSSALEFATAGQLDSHEEMVAQLAAAFAFDDATGTELEARIQEGVRPALEAKVNAEHRAKFVSLQDFVEADLRDKEADVGWLSEPDIYGIREDQVPILEEVSIREIEPEELLEEPIQFGVIPDEELVEAELDRAGVSEGVKDLFQEVVRAAPRSADVWEQRTTTETLVQELDALVLDGELSPDEAAERLPEEAQQARQALRDRWALLADLPGDAPSEADVLDWFGKGLISIDRAAQLLPQVGVDPEAHPAILQEVIVDELDGDLRTAVGLGLLEEGQYLEYGRLAGFDDQTLSAVLQGQDLDEVAQQRLQQAAEQGSLPVDTIPGIGSSRRAALEAAGFETVAAVATAEPQALLEVLDVSEATAQEFISRADQLVG